MPKDWVIIIVIFLIEIIFSESKKRFQNKARSKEFFILQKDQREAFENKTISKASIYCKKICN